MLAGVWGDGYAEGCMRGYEEWQELVEEGTGVGVRECVDAITSNTIATTRGGVMTGIRGVWGTQG